MRRVLFFLLILIGLAMALIGANTALGGMRTLGWQFSPDVLAVTDQLLFDRHDNNARFFGGVFVGFGVLMALSPLRFSALRPVVVAFLGCIALGGVARLLHGDYALISDGALLPSLIAELVGAPALAWWVWCTPVDPDAKRCNGV